MRSGSSGSLICHGMCRDDRDLDAMYRNQTRFGDPMAQYVKKRQPDDPLPVVPPPGKRRKAGENPASSMLLLKSSLVVP